ncbi:MAG: endonuclease/exonuclease/phosphatase family protein, partial [Planctomycetota bacterium]
LASWLDERLPVEGGWKVAVIDGDLRVAVASPSLEPSAALAAVERPLPEGRRTVRAVGAIHEFAGRRVLLISVHLKCCGSIGSREDRIREAEAQAIREAVREAMADAASDGRGIDGVVMGGDFNLVGGAGVLDEAARGLDLDGSPLAAAPLYGPTGGTNLTWRDARSEFMPGRLDFVLFSDARLELADGMVVDPAAFLPDDAAPDGPSDHLPLVVDLRWKAVAAAGRR